MSTTVVHVCPWWAWCSPDTKRARLTSHSVTLQAFPPLRKLLRSPEAEAVYAPRLAAASPLYRILLDAHRQDGMTWQDAWASFCSICDGNAPMEQLQQLVGLSLETIALGTPQV